MRCILLLRALALVVAVGPAACEWPSAPPLPAGAEPLPVPAVYETWWRLTETCAGRRGDFSAVRWYHVPNASTVDANGANGMYTRSAHRIVLAGTAVRLGDVVRHEMLHALLRAPGHPRAEFITRCGGYVACESHCRAEAGDPPPRDPGAVSVDPTALELTVTLVPDTPSTARLDGHFMLMVDVHNPGDAPVEVRLPASGDSGPSFAFGYTVLRSSSTLSFGNRRALNPEVVRFGPGETKRQVFDFHLGANRLLPAFPPGSYEFRGLYGPLSASAFTTIGR